MTETPEEVAAEEPSTDDTAARPSSATRTLAFVVLPVLALLLALGAAYFKWQDAVAGRTDAVRAESVQAARDITMAMLTYAPTTVDTQRAAVRERLTDPRILDAVVVPGAKEKGITAVGSVAAAASVTAEPERAVVLLFVNQTVAVGSQPPGVIEQSVRVTLDRVDGRWLVSGYERV